MNTPSPSRSDALTPRGEASVLDLLERLKKELGATPRDLGTRIVNALLIVDAAIIKVNSDPDRIAAICELDGCYELRAPASENREQLAELIPTTWLDPLLSGPNAVIPSTRAIVGTDIENLLRMLKLRIQNGSRE